MKADSEYRKGLILVLICQVFWGVCPAYWHALIPIEPWKIILYRIATMFVFSYIAARTRYTAREIFAPLREGAVRKKYFTAGLFLTVNWSVYIWAMTTGNMVQSSIGYYIEPIVICAVGVVFFKEKLTKYNVTAMALAVAAIIIILIHFGQVPGIALGLAGTWAVYSAIKKTSDLPVLKTLVYETAPYAVLSVIALIYLEARGMGVIGLGLPGKYGLLLLSGLVTLIPVALFSSAAKKVTLLVLGLMQYISPSITLVIGIFVFGEPVDTVQIIAFGMIWVGLAVFSCGEYRETRPL